MFVALTPFSWFVRNTALRYPSNCLTADGQYWQFDLCFSPFTLDSPISRRKPAFECSRTGQLPPCCTFVLAVVVGAAKGNHILRLPPYRLSQNINSPPSVFHQSVSKLHIPFIPRLYLRSLVFPGTRASGSETILWMMGQAPPRLKSCLMHIYLPSGHPFLFWIFQGDLSARSLSPS